MKIRDWIFEFQPDVKAIERRIKNEVKVRCKKNLFCKENNQKSRQKNENRDRRHL